MFSCETNQFIKGNKLFWGLYSILPSENFSSVASPSGWGSSVDLEIHRARMMQENGKKRARTAVINCCSPKCRGVSLEVSLCFIFVMLLMQWKADPEKNHPVRLHSCIVLWLQKLAVLGTEQPYMQGRGTASVLSLLVRIQFWVVFFPSQNELPGRWVGICHAFISPSTSGQLCGEGWVILILGGTSAKTKVPQQQYKSLAAGWLLIRVWFSLGGLFIKF